EVLRVRLKRNSGVRIEELKERLRRKFPEKLGPWLAEKLRAEGLPEERVAERVRGLRLSFEPADIVNEIMSFGSPTPVEVVVSGPKMPDNRAFADKLRRELLGVPSLRDLQYGQSLDYPTLDVRIDRERAVDSGVTADDVARSLTAATSSSRFTVPNYWRDPASGIGYQVQVEVPQTLMRNA